MKKNNGIMIRRFDTTNELNYEVELDLDEYMIRFNISFNNYKTKHYAFGVLCDKDIKHYSQAEQEAYFEYQLTFFEYPLREYVEGFAKEQLKMETIDFDTTSMNQIEIDKKNNTTNIIQLALHNWFEHTNLMSDSDGDTDVYDIAVTVLYSLLEEDGLAPDISNEDEIDVMYEIITGKLRPIIIPLVFAYANNTMEVMISISYIAIEKILNLIVLRLLMSTMDYAFSSYIISNNI